MYSANFGQAWPTIDLIHDSETPLTPVARRTPTAPHTPHTPHTPLSPYTSHTPQTAHTPHTPYNPHTPHFDNRPWGVPDFPDSVDSVVVGNKTPSPNQNQNTNTIPHTPKPRNGIVFLDIYVQFPASAVIASFLSSSDAIKIFRFRMWIDRCSAGGYGGRPSIHIYGLE
jgi:hypothetical protein